jgi:L-histidine Nalpha-methyltransferase
VAGDFARHPPAVPERGFAPRLVAFLGGDDRQPRAGRAGPLPGVVAGLMDDDDLLLMGTDLAGDAERIRAAYDDAEGVTAEFNLNMLRVLNRELGADFDLAAFEQVALYDPGPPWIEMRLRARSPQRVRVAALGMEVRLAAGEEMRTEVSCKFTRGTVAAMYADAGLRPLEGHEDPRGWFAVALARLA